MAYRDINKKAYRALPRAASISVSMDVIQDAGAQEAVVLSLIIRYWCDATGDGSKKLQVIDNTPCAVIPGEYISSITGDSQPTTSRQIKKLIDAGYLVCKRSTPDGNHRPVNVYAPTEKTLKLYTICSVIADHADLKRYDAARSDGPTTWTEEEPKEKKKKKAPAKPAAKKEEKKPMLSKEDKMRRLARGVLDRNGFKNKDLTVENMMEAAAKPGISDEDLVALSKYCRRLERQSAGEDI